MADWEERLGYLLDRAAARAELAEVYGVVSSSLPVEFENNRLKSLSLARHRGAALRVVAGGRLGFAASTSLEKPDLDGLVEDACRLAALGTDEPADLDLPSAVSPSPVPVRDNAVTALPPEDMLALGEEAVAALRRVHPDLQAFAGVEREESTVCLLNSRGARATYTGTGFAFWAGGELVEGENMLWAYDGLARANLGDAAGDARRLTERVASLLAEGRRNVPAVSGPTAVLFSPRALVDLLRPLLASLDGRAVERGLSPWKDRLGREVASSLLTLTDDATLPHGPRSAPFDGEGTPTRPTVLLEGGVLRSYYLDRRTARRLGLEPTGHGFRTLGSPPAPSLTNVTVAPGDRPWRELLREMGDGLYVEGLLGAWAGNPYAGEVQGNVSLGFLVRGGEPVGRVKNCVFAANAFAAFGSQLAALSAEREWAGHHLLPYALFEGIAVHAAG